MAETQEIQAPQVQDQQEQPIQGDPAEKYYNYLKKAGADTPPTFDSFKKTLNDTQSAQQYYKYLREKKFDAPPTFESFSKTLGVSPVISSQEPTLPEHEIQHTSVQDLRHLQEMANLPIRSESTATGGVGGSAASYIYNQEDVARNKSYKEQYEKQAQELSKTWGTDLNATKKTLNDFPDEQDENKLKNFASLSKQNPVIYDRLKGANDIRVAIAKSGQNGVNDANAFNHLQQADNYHELVEYNIPLQKEIMSSHNLGSQYNDILKNTQSPLINTLDPGLNEKYWNSDDKKLGLNISQYAGLETERLFSPNKAQMDLEIIKHAKGLDEEGQANPTDLKKQPYEYQRGVENVLYNLDKQGRENTARYIAGQKPQIEAQVNDALTMAQTKMNNAKTKEDQDAIKQEFNQNPLIQEATKLEQGQDELKYAEINDQRNYPLNFADQATRAVRDAMDETQGVGTNIGKWFGNILQGAGESADNTMRWIKNTAINLAGSEGDKTFNNAKNIGHQDLTELSAYEPHSYTGVESPFKIPDNLTKDVQSVFNDSSLSDSQKEQKATALVRDNFDQLEINPKAGQQNLTGKAAIFQAANVMGQILGIANQSFLLGGVIGDANKLQQMATTFTPMYMSTQNQIYEQALKNGDEHPLLKSNLDATIISLASLINPDIKVVRGMVGAESGVGKTLAGISDETWNKVLSSNKPIVDRAIGVAKATGKQLGLANLQYGLIVPTVEAISHKAIFNEDSNLGDKIKDAVIQTSLTMALPAILHGAWGGVKATDVNPAQKYAIVEAGLHSDFNIELIDGRIKAGEISEIRGHEMKQMVKHAGEILQNSEMVKTDGTPMNEKEVSDTVYNMLRIRILEGKLKNAAEPVKPIIEERIHELNKDIADLHTSESDKQKAELNQLLHDNLGRIKDKMPTMEGPIKDAIARNEPEEVYKEIASQALETTKVDGKEVSSRPLAEEIFGKALVEKAIELSKKPKKELVSQEEKNVPRSTNSEEGQNKTVNQSNIKPISEKVIPTQALRTWDLGDMEGKPEDAAAKKHIEGVVTEWDKHPAGETGGETFGQFIGRVIAAFKGILSGSEGNTAVITHSSVLKAFKVWDEMGRPEVDNLTPEQKKTFSDEYNKEETHNGDLVTFKGDNGDIHVIRHGQTEDNAKNNFRSGNTNLTEKGVQDAHNVGQELKDKTGGNIPQIITSDLPRAVHTSNIIHDKLSENATTEQSAGKMDVGQQASNGETVGGGDAGQSIPPGEEGNQTKEAPSGQQPGQVTGKEEDWPFIEQASDNKVTSTQHAITEEKVNAAGLVPAMKEAARDFGTVWAEAQKKINKGFNVDKLLDDLRKKPRAVTDLENAMILYQQNVKEAQLDAANKDMADAWEKGDSAKVVENQLTRSHILDDLQKIYDVDRAIGRETARGLNARKMMADRQFSLVNMQMEKRALKDGEPLTDQEQAEVEKKYNAIREANAAYEKRIADLEAENKALKIVKDKTKESGKPKKTNAEYSKERKDIVQRMRDDLLKAAKGGEGLTSSIPLAAQLKAVAPHISDLVKSFIDQGIDKLEGITAGIHTILKPLIPELTESHVHDLIAGEFKEPKIEEPGKEPSKPTQIKNAAKQQKYAITDPQAMKLRAEYERQKDSWNDDLKKIELSKRTNLDKVQDTFIKWERAFKLSGITTLGKLGMAAVTRMTTTPIEEGVGGIYSKMIPSIANKATGEGGLNVKAEAKAITSAFTQGMKDSYDILSKTKRGKSDIESVFGKKGELPPEALGFFGQLHSAVKAPVKRAAFERSMTKRITANLKNGVDVSDPLVQSHIALQAYKDANRAIFMQDNFVSDKYRSFISSLEKSKTYPELSKGTATVMQWMIPFVKVPTNIVGEVGTHVAGLPIGAAKIAHAVFTKGLKNLSEDEADMVMRNLKKGSLGAGALLLGYFNPTTFGGYYQQGEKRDDKDVKAGAAKIFGHTIPIWLLESPIFQTMQLGSTIRRVADTKVKDIPKGITSGIMAASLGLAEHEPLVDQPTRILEAIKSDKERSYFLDEMAKSTIEPALLQNIAEGKEWFQSGSVKHKPETLGEHLEMGVPGLREKVPTKNQKESRQPAHR